ncbi:transcription factor IBH1-like [Magnolia sinica]|uniref:transcription factor IBH1-like n=1 Tax=Magnolia sinica TaxID=86752 RepID=UPI002658B921|nr:transcription factor IBH1-like [Magnolia sinica]
MQASNSFKSLFLKKFLLGLQQGDLSSKNMSFLERKNAIKLSSDIALASARDGVKWSRALIANISKHEKNKILVQKILGVEFDCVTKPYYGSPMCKRVKSKMILRKSCATCRIRKRAPRRILASALAKRMVSKRTQMLKSLIPGGEFMDEFSLLVEGIDYIHSLRAQVEVMQRLANTFELLNRK